MFNVPAIILVFVIHRTNGHQYFTENTPAVDVRVDLFQTENRSIRNCSSVHMCVCVSLPGRGIKASCSGLGLTSVPKFNNYVISINLSQNNIERFPNNYQFPINLTILILSNNFIKSLENEPFDGLFNLVHLDLRQNQLEYLPNIYTEGLFNDLTSLKWLNLKDNNQDSDGKQYPEEIHRLTSLEELHLDGLKDADFPSNYSLLSSLTSLTFSSTCCEIQTITESSFAVFPKVQNLDLSWCDIRNIERGSLQRMSNLTRLDLSYNVYLTFRVLFNLTSDLRLTHVTFLKLDRIHCTSGVGTVIFKEDIKHLFNTSLLELSLKFNRLELVETGVVDVLPTSLQRFDISYNNLDNMRIIFDLIQMPNLAELDVSSQKHHLHPVRVGNMVNCKDWRGPDFNLRTPTEIPPKTTSNNVVYNIKRLQQMKNYTININVSQSLRDFYMKDVISMHGRFSLQASFLKDNNIEKISLKQNGIMEMNLIIRNLHRLQYFDISDNECFQISMEVFADFPSLRYLNMENNFLGRVLERDTDGQLFKYLGNLTHLNISNNGIGYVPVKLFRGLSTLRVLRVASNALSEWNVDIGHMTRLELLDLGHNKIQTFDAITRDIIDAISKSSQIKVNLSNNSLQCNCQTLAFLKWIKHKKSIFQNFDKYICFNAKLSVIHFTHIDAVIANLETNCSSYIGLIVGALVSIVMVILIVTTAIIYRYRWRLRYLYYMTKKGYRSINSTAQPEFEYDAFISYANEDRVLVEHELLERIEAGFGLKLLIHRRDFIAGNPISENITRSVHRSRRTVVMLSANYLKSYWCMFEFRMARMESIYSRGGEPTLFIVLLDDVKLNTLPLMMMDVIDLDSYIKVPPERTLEFWENLYSAISVT